LFNNPETSHPQTGVNAENSHPLNGLSITGQLITKSMISVHAAAL